LPGPRRDERSTVPIEKAGCVNRASGSIAGTQAKEKPMRRKSLVLIVIAAGCGLIASIGISQVLDNQASEKKGAPEMETVEIYVTNTHVAIGEVLTPQMVSLEQWPKDRVPDGAITEWEQVEDRRPRTPLYVGEPLLEAKLVDPNDVAAASDLIRDGYRALPVKVAAETTSGLVQPGDVVDVLVVLRQGGALKEAVARTILQRIRIFAINEQTIRRTDEEGNMKNTKTVTLEVTPEQVEILALADRLGDLTLSIRPPNDVTLAERPQGTNIGVLLGSREIGVEIEPEEEQVARGRAGGFADFVKKMAGSDSTRVAANPNTMPVSAGPRMIIYEPEGTRRFEFNPDGTSPREVASGDLGVEMAGQAETEEELDAGDETEMDGEDEGPAAANLAP
jgi:pilus assembly protein CpaB